MSLINKDVKDVIGYRPEPTLADRLVDALVYIAVMGVIAMELVFALIGRVPS